MKHRITIVDNDEFSHKCHEMIFPNGIRSIESDIFDLDEITNNDIVYLNFCGLGSSNKRALRFIRGRPPNTTMVSFAIPFRFPAKARTVDRFLRKLRMIHNLRTIEEIPGSGYRFHTLMK